MTKEESKSPKFICILFCLLFVLVPILFLIPLSFGNLVEFTVYYEDSAYFTNERASGIDILLDGVYYGTTDEFGMLGIRTPDQENHTMSILYNEGVIFEYLIEYGTETNTADIFIETKSLESEFRWDKVDIQDLVKGKSFELWFDRAGVFELVGTKTTDSLGMILFDGLIMGEYKFVGIDYEIPEVLIEFNQTTAFKSVDFLVVPVTVMFDFDYSESGIFGVDYPIEGLEVVLYGYERSDEYNWVVKDTLYTDDEGRVYFYNLKTWQASGWVYINNEYELRWTYDGVSYEQNFFVGDDLDFYYELACKEVSTTFNWDADGYPLATNVDVVLTFLDGTHTPMIFTTDMNGQVSISGLIMGNYDLDGAVFESIQSTHLKVIPSILLEPTKDRGVLKFWFEKHHIIILILYSRVIDHLYTTSP